MEYENYNCIDCGHYGDYEEFYQDDKEVCPKCGSDQIYSDEDWEDS